MPARPHSISFIPRNPTAYLAPPPATLSNSKDHLRPTARHYDQAPERTRQAKVIQSWDTAAKDGAQNDWSVCTTWLVIDGCYYLLDLIRGRFEYHVLRNIAIDAAKHYDPDEILIEDASTGVALAQELSRLGQNYVNPIPVDRDKQGRLYIQRAKFAAGHVFFLKDAPFLAELEAELLTFPQGRTDDQVDSISQALAYEASGYDSSLSWV